MTFEKQLQEAKRKKLENRMLRDVIFILLGIFFLITSIFSAYKEKENKKDENSNKNITINITKL